MWTRERLKTSAKEVLKANYWMAFAVCIVFAIITAFGSGNSSGYRSFTNRLGNNNTYTSSRTHMIDVRDYLDDNNNLSESQIQEVQQIVDSYFNPAVIAISIGALVFTLIISLLKLAFNIFVTSPMTVGYNKYFIDQHYGNANFVNLFDGFRGGKYMARVKVMFFYRLFIWLWSLLFIIPGIIKELEYFMIPYILADNPDISKDRAFEITKKTMDGEKWELFVLQLSFIGWILLGLLACCVGTYFVTPYIQATYCELYLVLRDKAIAKGIASPEEFNLTDAPAQY